MAWEWEDHYQDTGCELASSCLNCPLPVCKHDNPLGMRVWARRVVDRHWVQVMEQERLDVGQAAERFDCTVRTIFRVKQRVQDLDQGAGQGQNERL